MTLRRASAEDFACTVMSLSYTPTSATPKTGRCTRRALPLAQKRAGKLGDAADIMEEAFNKWPDLRGKYANYVKLWRCGISR